MRTAHVRGTGVQEYRKDELIKQKGLNKWTKNKHSHILYSTTELEFLKHFKTTVPEIHSQFYYDEGEMYCTDYFINFNEKQCTADIKKQFHIIIVIIVQIITVLNLNILLVKDII